MSLLDAALRGAARRFGERAAFISPGGEPLSFTQLDVAADEVAAGLRRRGVCEGAVLALLLPSDLDYAAIYLGAARAGAVTAGVSPLLTSREVNDCLDAVGADLVVTDAATAQRASPGSERVEVIDTYTAPARAGGALRWPDTGWRGATLRSQDAGSKGAASAHASHATSSDLEDLAADNPAVCICFTSGSTGAPKAAYFGDRQLRAVAEMDAGGAWGSGHGISSTHFAHVAFMTKLGWMLACGRSTHLLARRTPQAALALTARYRMTSVAGVAPQIALMVKHPDIHRLDFSCVRAVVSGGAASPPELVREARRCFGAPYSNRYSSTESGGIGLATALDADDDEACHSIGRPRAGVKAEIRREDGSLAPPGETGELWIKSASAMSGYWRDEARTAEALRDGWLRTGDLASLDDLGLFRLAGRLSDMYVRGGYNVHPAEVEAVLAAHSGVAEVAVVAQPDAVMGETGLAVVVPADPAAPPTLRELRDFAAPTLAHYKLPEAIRLSDGLPRNEIGKVERRRLR